jgi:hypothetical protein
MNKPRNLEKLKRNTEQITVNNDPETLFKISRNRRTERVDVRLPEDGGHF